ncbi:MAG: chemotaxis protein CheW [Myxococcales bacterium]|jgi:purine-binding chemotaxis protein CheW
MEATPSVIVPSPSVRREALLFESCEQRFALALSDVTELTRACSVQALPKAPDVVIGVVNLRGQIVPVLDIRRRLGLPEKALEPSDCFMFARVAEQRVALRVDRLLGIEELSVTPLGEAPNLPERLAYVAGVAAVADGVVFIYDLEQFLSGAEASVLDRALSLAEEGGA